MFRIGSTRRIGGWLLGRGMAAPASSCFVFTVLCLPAIVSGRVCPDFQRTSKLPDLSKPLSEALAFFDKFFDCLLKRIGLKRLGRQTEMIDECVHRLRN